MPNPHHRDDYVPDRESWIRGYAQAVYDNLAEPSQRDWGYALIAADSRWRQRQDEAPTFNPDPDLDASIRVPPRRRRESR